MIRRILFMLLIGTLVVSPAVEDTWMQKADMPTARYGLSTSVVNGKIYAIGGLVGESVYRGISSVEEYDPAIDKWTKKASMPTERIYLSTSVVNGKIYAIGGTWLREPSPFKTVEEYDPATDTWTKKADMPTARHGLSTSVVNGKIYAMGGEAELKFERAPLSTVEEYDPATDTWTKKADMPTAKELHCASVVNGRIYVTGGRLLGGPSTIEEYDPAIDTWVKKLDTLAQRAGWSSMNVVNGRIYLTTLVDRVIAVKEYDPSTDTWTRKADMPTSRALFSTSVVNGKIYAIGGVAYGGHPILTLVEEYTP